MTTKVFKELYGVSKEEVIEALSTIVTTVINRMAGCRLDEEGYLVYGDSEHLEYPRAKFSLTELINSGNCFNERSLLPNGKCVSEFLMDVTSRSDIMDMCEFNTTPTDNKIKKYTDFGFLGFKVPCSQTINFSGVGYGVIKLNFNHNSASTCAGTYISEIKRSVVDALNTIADAIRRNIVEEDKMENNKNVELESDTYEGTVTLKEEYERVLSENVSLRAEVNKLEKLANDLLNDRQQPNAYDHTSQFQPQHAYNSGMRRNPYAHPTQQYPMNWDNIMHPTEPTRKQQMYSSQLQQSFGANESRQTPRQSHYNPPPHTCGKNKDQQGPYQQPFQGPHTFGLHRGTPHIHQDANQIVNTEARLVLANNTYEIEKAFKKLKKGEVDLSLIFELLRAQEEKFEVVADFLNNRS